MLEVVRQASNFTGLNLPDWLTAEDCIAIAGYIGRQRAANYWAWVDVMEALKAFGDPYQVAATYSGWSPERCRQIHSIGKQFARTDRVAGLPWSFYEEVSKQKALDYEVRVKLLGVAARNHPDGYTVARMRALIAETMKTLGIAPVNAPRSVGKALAAAGEDLPTIVDGQAATIKAQAATIEEQAATIAKLTAQPEAEATEEVPPQVEVLVTGSGKIVEVVPSEPGDPGTFVVVAFEDGDRRCRVVQRGDEDPDAAWEVVDDNGELLVVARRCISVLAGASEGPVQDAPAAYEGVPFNSDGPFTREQLVAQVTALAQQVRSLTLLVAGDDPLVNPVVGGDLYWVGMGINTYKRAEAQANALPGRHTVAGYLQMLVEEVETPAGASLRAKLAGSEAPQAPEKPAKPAKAVRPTLREGTRLLGRVDKAAGIVSDVADGRFEVTVGTDSRWMSEAEILEAFRVSAPAKGGS